MALVLGVLVAGFYLAVEINDYLERNKPPLRNLNHLTRELPGGN
jgi:hypothetical protein